VHPGVGGALLLLLFLLAVHVCSVCKGERGEIEGLVPIILRPGPVHWVSLRPCTGYIAGAGIICYPNAGNQYQYHSSAVSRSLVSGVM